MVALLAFIGIIAILWLAQKGLTKISNWFYELSNECLDYIRIKKQREIEVDRALQQKNKNTVEAIQDIKKERPHERTADETFSFYSDLSKGRTILFCKDPTDEH